MSLWNPAIFLGVKDKLNITYCLNLFCVARAAVYHVAHLQTIFIWTRVSSLQPCWQCPKVDIRTILCIWKMWRRHLWPLTPQCQRCPLSPSCDNQKYLQSFSNVLGGGWGAKLPPFENHWSRHTYCIFLVCILGIIRLLRLMNLSPLGIQFINAWILELDIHLILGFTVLE